ncbi:MAG: hypothetical protein MRERV_4c043 [Mycoplasmataceae bacterium RV_VA103A]|nr:MAG: hypothetical protein MRERV_11c006 [Mycoplasmataceae bacterium RV_VA103A]KLL05152.1 MAG: hypothetical protein MRERV_4c043 [Mycoplasmataceae bacterium RV_VA103A]
MKKNNIFTEREEKAFNKLLEKLEDPNYQGGAYSLPESPTPLQKSKYEICQKILDYKLTNHLSTEAIAKRINLSKIEAEEILFCQIEKFTLDRLVSYASELFTPLEIKITKAEVRKLHA